MGGEDEEVRGGGGYSLTPSGRSTWLLSLWRFSFGRGQMDFSDGSGRGEVRMFRGSGRVSGSWLKRISCGGDVTAVVHGGQVAELCLSESESGPKRSSWDSGSSAASSVLPAGGRGERGREGDLRGQV